MCMIDYADERPEFCGSLLRTARKVHQCGECGRDIQPGERYRYGHGKQEGEFYTAKVCAHCEAAGQLLIRECGGYLYGGILEDLEEHITEALPWSRTAARYVVSMRRKWRCIRSAAMMPVPIVVAS